MAKYISSGKINFVRIIPGLIFGIASAVLLGLAYGWAMDLIPFIIVDLLVLFGVIALLLVVAIGVVHMSMIRNNAVKVITVLIVCLVAWYSQWVYTSQYHFWSGLLKYDRVFEEILSWGDTHELTLSRGFSSSSTGGIGGIALMIFYGIELLLFLSPIAFVFMFQKNYFCESCRKFYLTNEFYVRELDQNKVATAETTGDFRFIAEYSSHKDTPGVTGPAWHIEFSHCEECKQQAVIDIGYGVVEMDSKDKKFTFNRKQKVVEKTIASAATIEPLTQKQHTFLQA